MGHLPVCRTSPSKLSAPSSEGVFGTERQLSITLENVGSDPADELIVTLTTDDEHVVMMDNTETVNMSAGDSMTINGFMADISSNIPNGHPIEFNVNLVTGEHEWDYSFISMSMAPEINLVNEKNKLSKDRGLKNLILEKKYNYKKVSLSEGVTIDFDTIEDFNL